MSKTIQIRDVPTEVHNKLAAAAAAKGQSLTKYLHTELTALARQQEQIEHNRMVLRGRRTKRPPAPVAQILDALDDGRAHR